jgi:ribosome-binding ATPase YchF (GTP1/OBG family)
VKQALEQGRGARGVAETDDELLLMRDIHLLTDKPVLYVANVAEDDLTGSHPAVTKVRELAEREGAKVVVICGSIEAEISSWRRERDVLSEMGLAEWTQRLIGQLQILGSMPIFTAGKGSGLDYSDQDQNPKLQPLYINFEVSNQ